MRPPRGTPELSAPRTGSPGTRRRAPIAARPAGAPTTPRRPSTRRAARRPPAARRRPRTRRATRSRCRAWAAGTGGVSIRRGVVVRPVGVRPDLHVRVELVPLADLEHAVRDPGPLLRVV